MPWATVLRNAAFGLELRGVPRREREATAREYVDKVGLSGFEDSYPHQLSGGMRQRVGLARALAVDADILLMDEPFASVDEQIRRQFQEDLLRLLSDEQDGDLRDPFDRGGRLRLRPDRHPDPRPRPGVEGRSPGCRPQRRLRRDPAELRLPRLGRADLARAPGLPGEVTWSSAGTGFRWRSRCWCGSPYGRSSGGSTWCRCSRPSPRCSPPSPRSCRRRRSPRRRESPWRRS